MDHMLAPNKRLKEWREFRKSLETLNPEDKLNHVAHYWANAPLVNYLLAEKPTEWPTPWELIYDGVYCKNAVSYLMKKTLELNSNEKPNLKLKKISENNEHYMVLVVDDKYVLNYEHNTVKLWEEVENNFEMIEDV